MTQIYTELSPENLKKFKESNFIKKVRLISKYNIGIGICLATLPQNSIKVLFEGGLESCLPMVTAQKPYPLSFKSHFAHPRQMKTCQCICVHLYTLLRIINCLCELSFVSASL